MATNPDSLDPDETLPYDENADLVEIDTEQFVGINGGQTLYGRDDDD